jgi:hypothetical protein
LLDIDCKWRVLDLNGIDVVDFTSTSKRVGGDLAKTEVLDFALAVQSSVSCSNLRNPKKREGREPTSSTEP